MLFFLLLMLFRSVCHQFSNQTNRWISSSGDCILFQPKNIYFRFSHGVVYVLRVFRPLHLYQLHHIHCKLLLLTLSFFTKVVYLKTTSIETLGWVSNYQFVWMLAANTIFCACYEAEGTDYCPSCSSYRSNSFAANFFHLVEMIFRPCCKHWSLDNKDFGSIVPLFGSDTFLPMRILP